MSVNTIAQGYRPDDPHIPSYGELKLTRTETIYIGEPIELDTSQGTSGVDIPDQNKRWVKRYSSTDSTAQSLGVSYRNLQAYNHADHLRTGMGAFRRDLGVLQWGIIEMYNAGSTALSFGERVAPYYNSGDAKAGVQSWSSGMYILGYCWQQEIPAGHMGIIFVDVASTPAAASSLLDLSDTTITTPSAGEILQYHAVNGWTNQALTIAEATECTLSGSYTDGDVLVYDTDAFKDIPLVLSTATDYTETSIASGQTIMWDGSSYVNATLISELLSSPTTTGDNHEFTATGTPLAVVDVFSSGADQVPDVKYLYDATATVPTLSYNWSGTTISTNKATDADTHIMVTYWYDENA